jgi:hypothetical protein
MKIEECTRRVRRQSEKKLFCRRVGVVGGRKERRQRSERRKRSRRVGGREGRRQKKRGGREAEG